MSDAHIRWQQRLDNYSRALSRLSEAVALYSERMLSNIEKLGFIKAFEFTHELAWKLIKDYAVYQGETQINGSRDATRFAFKAELLEDGEHWMEMIATRNRAVHTYNDTIMNEVIEQIDNHYHRLFLLLEAQFKHLQRSALS